MTKKKSTKRIKVMAIVMALSVIVCGVAVGVAASTKSDYDDYYIVTADGQDIGKGIPYEEDTDIKKFIDKYNQVCDDRQEYYEVMDFCPISSDDLYDLHAKWVYDKTDQIYKISFTPDPKNVVTYYILKLPT